MSEEYKKDPIERMTEAYESMLGRVDEMLEKAESRTIPTLKKSIEQAREKAVELNELTREEADKLAVYLERDMQDAARFLSETGDELREWWLFDVELVERRLLELFASVADRTSIELDKFANQALEASLYHTGEVTGPGTLVCVECGKTLSFHKAGHIPPCPGCRTTRYRRSNQSGE
ncbi:MAG: zinc ribbon-containing protein [Gammaproteobacteria bacterium]|nr:zinc ribbon-containing protein [Gammaproteobacteria bacterium]